MSTCFQPLPLKLPIKRGFSPQHQCLANFRAGYSSFCSMWATFGISTVWFGVGWSWPSAPHGDGSCGLASGWCFSIPVCSGTGCGLGKRLLCLWFNPHLSASCIVPGAVCAARGRVLDLGSIHLLCTLLDSPLTPCLGRASVSSCCSSVSVCLSLLNVLVSLFSSHLTNEIPA